MCDTDTPAQARGWSVEHIGELLPSHIAVPIIDDATLVISELLTNALLAGCHSATLELAVETGTLRVSVLDDAPGEPHVVQAKPEDAHGRGLWLVAAIARDWGVTFLGQRKRVWAELPLALW
ncbi:MAG: ATP-binding protein [Actinomycetota bacterium]|nr:ATP-binding protein [Actinomycetota bacterium]